MGKSGFIPGQDERSLESSYKIRGKKGVHRILKNIHRLYEQRYKRQDISDLLLDVKLAIQKAKLTRLENNVLHYKYLLGKNIHEISKIENITTRHVEMTTKKALIKIGKVFRKWNY